MRLLVLSSLVVPAFRALSHSWGVVYHSSQYPNLLISALHQRVQEEQARLERVEARLRLIAQERSIPIYDVAIKAVEPQIIAAVRDPADIGEMPRRCRALFDQAADWANQHGARIAGPAFAIYYNDEYTERNIDIEAALPAVAGALERAGVSPDQVRAWRNYGASSPTMRARNLISCQPAGRRHLARRDETQDQLRR